jgi:hypothetical protein
MVFQSLGNHLSRESALRRIFQIDKGFGMIVSRKRLGRSGEGTILFHLELGTLFEAQDVLYAPGLKNN